MRTRIVKWLGAVNPRSVRSYVRALALLGGVLAVLLLGWLTVLYVHLPKVDRLENPEYSLPTTIFDRHGNKVQEIFIKRRKLVTYDQLPRHLINGLIAKEDSRFFEHHGIDPLRMLKAAWVNLINLSTVQGASTLTQQTARQFFLTLDKTWTRKVNEILLALKIEREFTKEEILTLYLNKVNFGDAWGVEAAAEYYFSKTLGELTLSESATLVGLLPAPNRYKPTRNPIAARKQRNIVLQRMAEEGFIARAEQVAAASEPVALAEREDPTIDAAASYVELVRRTLLDKYGSKNLYEGGLRVYTAMDLGYQVAAHRALLNGVRALDRRRGYRGADERVELDAHGQVPDDALEFLNPPESVHLNQILRGIVLEVNAQRARVGLGLQVEGAVPWDRTHSQWAQRIPPEQEEPVPLRALSEILKPGDVIQVVAAARNPKSGEYTLDLYQEPLANGAVYAMDPNSGYVVAMVGGTRFGKGKGASEFIRATQSERQPGSAFKAIIYAAAVDEGFTAATLLDDSPRVFTLDSGRKHIPKNYDNLYIGPTTLREALVRSRNVPTVQLVDEMTPRKVIDYARKLGLTTPIPEENIIALGTHSVRLAELTRAYGVFANLGKLVEPVYIVRIEDANGKVLEETRPQSKRVISEDTAYLISDMLQDVVRSPFGTGHRAMAGLKRPAAGKTGTTQNYTDAWYLGYIPQIVTGVYVGFDDPRKSLGPSETGSRAAAPVWAEFMKQIQVALPIETFQQPPTVVAHRVDRNGQLLDPCSDPAGTRFEFFKASSIPERLRGAAGCMRPAITSPRPRAPTGKPEDVEL
ncbi:MAG: PBP1A family penicillin-binding protein [Candidatus Lambdaproteobacteria bacterium]|nr:PBP1A family penicillin-binding protein [Candidatus Lambdaproteobacteria bacterium]